MKKKRSLIKRILVCLFAIITFAQILPVNVYANEYESDRLGSITIQLNDIETSLYRVEFECYRVARVRMGTVMNFDLLDEYEECGVSINSLYTAEDYRNAIELFSKRIEESELKGEKKKTDKEGIVKFEELQHGIYLIVQKDPNNYGYVDPFLVQIPYTQSGSEWIYDVEVLAKGEKFPIVPVNTQPVKTGDESRWEIWLVVVVLAGGAVFAINKKRKK